MNSTITAGALIAVATLVQPWTAPHNDTGGYVTTMDFEARMKEPEEDE